MAFNFPFPFKLPKRNPGHEYADDIFDSSRMSFGDHIEELRARLILALLGLMVGVVRSGTGTAAAIPGVTVAGKTGTAELRPNSKNPKDADAWFVAFAPAQNPKVAVAVMMVGAGFGGTAAAPVARKVLQAAMR